MNIRAARAGVSNSVIQTTTDRLKDYIGDLRSVQNSTDYSAPESSLRLPFDSTILASVDRIYRETNHKNLKYVVVVGIGGSNLGAKAIYDAFWGSYDTLEPERGPKILWADTSDSIVLEKITHVLKKCAQPEEYVVIYISKSGSTSETALNGSLIWRTLGGENTKNRWVVISDKNSPLTKEATKEGIQTLEIPETVGGRYSVFSVSGLLPLRYLTGNLEQLLSGAREMADKCLVASGDNPALLGVAALSTAKSQGLRVHDTFLFNPQLESIGKWYRQLLAESIGKEKNLADTIVREGILPTVSIGSTDLHSIGQLYLGGPRMSFTSFISIERGVFTKKEEATETPWEKIVPAIKGRSPEEIMAAIRDGVQAAYKERDLPYLDIRWDAISLHNIGAYMQWKMIETMLLGKLLNINPFDQPSVELYKSETRKILDTVI